MHVFDDRGAPLPESFRSAGGRLGVSGALKASLLSLQVRAVQAAWLQCWDSKHLLFVPGAHAELRLHTWGRAHLLLLQAAAVAAWRACQPLLAGALHANAAVIGQTTPAVAVAQQASSTNQQPGTSRAVQQRFACTCKRAQTLYPCICLQHIKQLDALTHVRSLFPAAFLGHC